MALDLDDTEEIGGDAPRPVHADTVARGAFERLGEGQGAMSHRRGRGRMARVAHGAHAAHAPSEEQLDEPHFNKKMLIALIVGALAVIVLVVMLFIRVLSAPKPGTGATAVVEQTAVPADETISYRGATYALVENVEGYALAESREGGNGQYTMLGDVPGTPVELVLFDGTLVIPENLPNGTWDVLAYTIGSGWSQIMDSQGNVQAGNGTISEAVLDGSKLRLVVDGATVEVPLTW